MQSVPLNYTAPRCLWVGQDSEIRSISATGLPGCLCVGQGFENQFSLTGGWDWGEDGGEEGGREGHCYASTRKVASLQLWKMCR